MLWGVIYGIRSFVPVMIEQEEPGHVVNTSSLAGVVTSGQGMYSVAKHDVVVLSECLYLDLCDIGAPIGVSVLCPGGVQTNIIDSARNMPPEIATEPQPQVSEGQRARTQAVLGLIESGLAPAEVADITLAGIRKGDFYILTDRSFDGAIMERARRIVAGERPEPAV